MWWCRGSRSFATISGRPISGPHCSLSPPGVLAWVTATAFGFSGSDPKPEAKSSNSSLLVNGTENRFAVLQNSSPKQCSELCCSREPNNCSVNLCLPCCQDVLVQTENASSPVEVKFRQKSLPKYIIYQPFAAVARSTESFFFLQCRTRGAILPPQTDSTSIG